MITLTILLIIALLCVLVGLPDRPADAGRCAGFPFCGRAGGCAGRISGRALYGHGNFPWPQHPDGRAGQLCGRVFVRPAGHPRLRQLFFLCHFGNRCLHLHLGRPEDLQVSFLDQYAAAFCCRSFRAECGGFAFPYKQNPRKPTSQANFRGFLFGATDLIRTGDLLITSELLYQLSHSSTLHICCNRQYFTIFLRCCQGRISCKRAAFAECFTKSYCILARRLYNRIDCAKGRAFCRKGRAAP